MLFSAFRVDPKWWELLQTWIVPLLSVPISIQCNPNNNNNNNK